MSLSQRSLSAIQKAGQAVHGASEAIAANVADQAKSMVAQMASQPFGAESEQAIAAFKQLSSLNQGLKAIESRLQELYALASDLASPASDVILLPSTGVHLSAESAAAVDVVAKPPKAPKKLKRSGRKSAALTANDAKLLAFLKGKLQANKEIALTRAQISAGSNLPLGSLGQSLKKVLATGAVKVTGRGTYQLGAAVPGSPAPGATPTVASKRNLSMTMRHLGTLI